MPDQWLQQYGKYVEEAPTIDFNGTLFVFMGLLDSPKDNPIVKKVIEKGGQYRTSVSGLTDYLVVNPSGAGYTNLSTICLMNPFCASDTVPFSSASLKFLTTTSFL